MAGITQAPHDGAEWFLVIAFSFPVILIDEVLKAVGRAMNNSERAARIKETEEKFKQA